MGVDRLAQGENQPFYNVRVSDESTRYAAQESLQPHPDPKDVTYSRIGAYFTRREGDYYVPNKELAKLYPGDADYWEANYKKEKQDT